jgi:hypothetical protein
VSTTTSWLHLFYPKVAIKYRNRLGNTWAGRKARSTWLQEKIKVGAKTLLFKGQWLLARLP